MRLTTLFCGLFLLGVTGSASALTLDLIEGADDAVAELSAALLAPSSGITIVADTADSIYDSGVFIGNLFAGTSTGDGGIGDGGPAPVPEPSTIVLMGAGLLGLVFTRKRMKK